LKRPYGSTARSGTPILSAIAPIGSSVAARDISMSLNIRRHYRAAAA
jgi:hypothetical protein